jgi:hypothetical protein
MGEEPGFQRQPLIGASGDLAADTEAWLACEPLAVLVAQFGGDPAVYRDSALPLATGWPRSTGSPSAGTPAAAGSATSPRSWT